tara:strand:+ start:1107 stop:1658 length:552 start_codon:yes stop_codon:yes gene_type:complete
MAKKTIFSISISENVIKDSQIDLWIDKTLDFTKQENLKAFNSNLGGYQTPNVLDAEITNLFGPYIGKALEELFNSKSNIYVTNLWINENPKGSANSLHTHPRCQFSAIYYKEVHKNCGDVTFYRSDMASLPLHKVQHFNENRYYTVTPKKGLFIIFPAYLLHSVSPNQEEKNRVSVSFNFNLE